MDLKNYNRKAWDHLATIGDQWTRPVSPAIIAAARQGNWEVVLTQHKAVPKHWFPPLQHLKVLGLASGGGQQGPILAAAGADVTILDNSPKQLERDQMVAAREGLVIKTELGNMEDLSRFPNQSFDLVFNPCSICFVADPQTVWQEVARVLKPEGCLLSGFTQPAIYMFDERASEEGRLVVRHKHPYSDLTRLNEEELARLKAEHEPILFGHSLTSLIGGQARAGLALVDLYEDAWHGRAFDAFTPAFIATKSKKIDT